MSDRKRTVVKFGGSLLHSPVWATRLLPWLNQQPAGKYFFIVGGGLLIDALRDLDECHGLSQVEMHWRCIRLLDATYEIVAELMPGVETIESAEQLHTAIEMPIEENETRVHLVRIASYYNPESDGKASTELKLEYGWNTTSDSLALLLASRIGAQRCVLLKSCDVKHLKSLQQAVDEEVVDSQCIRFQSIVPTIEFVQI